MQHSHGRPWPWEEKTLHDLGKHREEIPSSRHQQNVGSAVGADVCQPVGGAPEQPFGIPTV